MLSKRWRVGVGIILGGFTAFLLFRLVQLSLLYARDAAPHLMDRWAPPITTVGALGSGLFGIVVLLFVARSSTGPALLRRIGISTGTFGLAVLLGGIVLFFMPKKPPVHPGRMAVGDMAAGSIALFVLFAGAIMTAVAVFVVVAGLSWSWLRRTKEATARAS